jgi:glycosyltransferase involved in cell wall biosynthesis
LKSLPLGGIETWLMHVLRCEQDSFVQHELLLMVEAPGVYEPEARDLGYRIHKLPKNSSWISWFADFRRFLGREGPFDVVHSHVAFGASAPIIAIAALAGVPSRIAHQHEARSIGVDFRGMRDGMVRRAAMLIYGMTATRRIGITETAIEEIAGKGWRSKKNCSILLYGFDYSAFDGAEKRARELRRTLRLKPHHRVIGHVGRFDPVKNHAFLLKTFATIARADPNARLVMIGRGKLEPPMRELAGQLNITDAVRFAGSTQDIAAYMALFDLFLFPSLSEGLGIVCVEAQAAGTRVLTSDTVPGEAAVVAGGVEFLPLSAGEGTWANHALDLLALPEPDAGEWRQEVEQSAFGLDRCLLELEAIYREELGLPA